MGISDKAKKNYEELFPGRKSRLHDTDPEFMEIFDNFAFDEVLDYGNLDARTRMIVILASLIAQQTVTGYKIMLEAALNVGVAPVEIKEIVYQSTQYVGMAKALDFLNATNDLFKNRGIKLPVEGQTTVTPETAFDKGRALLNSVFGEMIENNYKKAPENQKHIQHYLFGNCFGKYYTRGGLDIKMRELITFAMLLSLGGCEPQLKAHIKGNLSVGNSKETLLSIVTQLLPYIGYPRMFNALACLNEVIPEEKKTE